MAREIIEHEGETFEVEYKEYIECEHCGNCWASSSDKKRPSCSSCRRKTDRNVYGKLHEDMTRYSLLNYDGIEDIEDVNRLLRRRARKYEAMTANGWELNSVGGQSSVFLTKGDIDPDIVE